MKRMSTLFFAAALFCVASFTSAEAQIVEKVKDAAEKTKDVTVETTKKVGEVAKDGAEKVEDGTKAGVSKSKKVGSHIVTTTDNVVGQAYEGGKYYTVKTWDGSKWVTKRVWFATKKAVVGENEVKP